MLDLNNKSLLESGTSYSISEGNAFQSLVANVNI